MAESGANDEDVLIPELLPELPGLTAARRLVSKLPDQTPERRLVDLLSNPKLADAWARAMLSAFSRTYGGLAAGRLAHGDLAALSDLLASELQVTPSILGEMGQLFWRFNADSDGLLSEDDSARLCIGMLRRYRDVTQPPRQSKADGACNGMAARRLDERYSLARKVAAGGQGAVLFGSRLNSDQQVVVKMFDKSNPSAPAEEIASECETLARLRHPAIARVLDIFQDDANIYMVQEPCYGGDLCTNLRLAADVGVRIDERWLAMVMRQVLVGVGYLHSHGIIHCDVKESNIVIAGKSDWHSPQVVLIDVGLAHAFTTRPYPGGTPGYMPPEVWESGLWTPRGDVFSVGTVLFVLRTGTRPFSDGCRSLEEVRRRTGEHSPAMLSATEPLRNLATSMVEKDLRYRPTVAAIMEDAWLTGSSLPSTESNGNGTNGRKFNGSQNGAEGAAIEDEVLQALAAQASRAELRQQLLTDLASRENLVQMRELNDFFLELDSASTGAVSEQGVRLGLAGRWPEDRVEALVQALPSSGQGEVSYEELMAQIIAALEPAENELLLRAFSEVDQERRGYLGLGDASGLLRRLSIAKVVAGRNPDALLREMDGSGSGRISFDDFRRALQSRPNFFRGEDDAYVDELIGASTEEGPAQVTEGPQPLRVLGSALEKSHHVDESPAASQQSPASHADSSADVAAHGTNGGLRPWGARRRRLPSLLGSNKRRHWQVGHRLEFYSTAEEAWLPCAIIHWDQNAGELQVDLCPGYWIRGVELLTRVREPPPLYQRMLTGVGVGSWGWLSCASSRCTSVRQRLF